MLLVDHREAEILVSDSLLEDRMGADQDIDRTVGQAHQHAVPGAALFARRQDCDADA